MPIFRVYPLSKTSLIRLSRKWDGNLFSVDQEMDYSGDISETYTLMEMITTVAPIQWFLFH